MSGTSAPRFWRLLQICIKSRPAEFGCSRSDRCECAIQSQSYKAGGAGWKLLVTFVLLHNLLLERGQIMRLMRGFMTKFASLVSAFIITIALVTANAPDR